ncbi:GNAT family N-acetyltransferase [candidate division WOR-3 bacterium]|uniref:GNAT family N-acetyltransferase n=1 Tax=candidate division WOR-3 bacterium TaxID=2052148 RepID=A0A937XCT8_UNCW3|nr:GNAT family N-acetyltransferase [candidate division WOR-3 bacterium]
MKKPRPSNSKVNFSIRRAGTRDLPELKRMRIALQDLLMGRDPRVWRLSQELIDTLEEFYAKVMERDENRVFVAAAPGGKPVGMLLARILDNPNLDPRPFGRIDDAWVDPEWRERGVMTGLTRAAAQFLATHRVSMVMLDWANNNPPSGTCWQKLGFEPLMTMGFASPAGILSRKE